MLAFNNNATPLTLGIEIEVQLLDPETLDLTPVATELFKITEGCAKIKPEIFLSMAEITTGICHDAHEAEKDLGESMNVLKSAAKELNILLSTTGTHPFAKYSERIPYPSERYAYLMERNQWIARRIMIYGLHVHLGMKDGDSCISFNNFLLCFLPHLLALTSSSPFWQGQDTGLASSRSTIFESCPTAGHPCRVENWQEFSDLCAHMVQTKSIGSHKDLWWDIRPSPEFGTLEIRICDGLSNLSEALEIAALIHTLAHWYAAGNGGDLDTKAPAMWMMRENKWRALRHGLEADIIPYNDMKLSPVRHEITEWLDRIAPYGKKLGYEKYLAGIHETLAKGASYSRQRKVFEKAGSIKEVALHNATEFDTNQKIYL